MKKLKYLLFLLLWGDSISSAYAKPTIVIDPGHQPSLVGAKGTCGKEEVKYNDALAATLVDELSSTYRVILTRESQKEVNLSDPRMRTFLQENKKNQSLLARPMIANINQADVFISIHHDSTSAIHQKTDSQHCHGKGGITLRESFKKQYKIGFNIFIDDNKKREQRDSSLFLAELIGKNMLRIGRVPSNYHVYPVDDCKSCRPVNEKLGVWHENLAVLRDTQMPAVLIEVGNIVDIDDENIINNDAFRIQFSREIKAALDEFFAKNSFKQIR